MKEEVIKEIDLREKTLNKILEKIKEEEHKLCLREETFETRRHLFCEDKMSQDLEYDILKLREAEEEFRKIKRDFLNEMQVIHDEFVDFTIKIIAEYDELHRNK